jgi:hypothetical protein
MSIIVRMVCDGSYVLSLNGSEIDLNPLIPSASLKHPIVLQIDPPNVITTDAGSMYICIAVMSKLLLLRTPKITMAIPPIIESSDADKELETYKKILEEEANREQLPKKKVIPYSVLDAVPLLGKGVMTGLVPVLERYNIVVDYNR